MFVLELAEQFRALGYTVDIATRRFDGQPEFDDMGPSRLCVHDAGHPVWP